MQGCTRVGQQMGEHHPTGFGAVKELFESMQQNSADSLAASWLWQ